ncbi:MAG TPA: CcdB family protein [Acetobacteraceae bacterium]|nr:CcdB family protein [Acetobacteraceae bacterium]
MARLDVWRAHASRTRGYLLEVQSDLRQALDTRAVVPLLPRAAVSKLNPLLNPSFEMEGQTWFLATQAIGVVRTSRLTGKVANLMDHEDAVIKAIDHLLLGG